MDTLQDFTEIIKVTKFIEKYTDLNVNGGIRHRIANKGTSPAAKQTSISEAENKAIDAGIVKLVADLQNLRKTLKSKK